MIETDEHQLFRKTLRDLFEREIEPHVDEWEAARTFPAHELFPKLASVGLFGLEYDEAYGGMGADHTYSLIAGEEMGRISCGGVPMAIAVQMSMATPALARYGSHELKERYLAPAIRGEVVTSIAVTEPDAGSDVAGIRTRAVRDGDEWVINGAKLYITNGTQADWLCLLARTSDDPGYQRHVAHRGADGRRRRAPCRASWRSSACGRATRRSCRSPTCASRWPTPSARSAGASSSRWCSSRPSGSSPSTSRWAPSSWPSTAPRTTCASGRAFGAPLAGQPAPAVRAGRAVGPPRRAQALRPHHGRRRRRGARTPPASPPSASCSGSRLQREVADVAVQFHGGMGYMDENWTSRYFRDTRLDSIGAGADEVMLRILARMDGYTAE